MSNDTEMDRFRKEMIALIYRWSQESDITVGDMLIANHQAISTVLESGEEEEMDDTQ